MELCFNGTIITLETEQTIGNFKITFTKDPQFPHIVITPQVTPENITLLYINAEPYISLGNIEVISEDSEKIKEGKEEYIYENEYLVTTALAEKAANNLLKKYRYERYILDKSISITYCPGIELREIIRISESDTFFDDLCEVIGINDDMVRTVDSFNLDTKIQCATLNIYGFDDSLIVNSTNLLGLFGKIINGQDTIQLQYQVGSSIITTSNITDIITNNLTLGVLAYIQEIYAVVIYEGSNKWKIIIGKWTTANRPTQSWVAEGSLGLNTDTNALEKYVKNDQGTLEWGLFG